MILDHLYLSVRDYDRARDFYRAALAPLGISLVMEVGPEQPGRAERAAAFGRGGKPELFLATRGAPAANLHVALAAPDRAAVRAFHAAALAAGATDNRAPGLRPHYHEHYYGAFVLDPDGHNLEAVCHAPETA
jgi:catechol 2,3-dioxygenase-like lactoylglutathione lyase family enzyme